MSGFTAAEITALRSTSSEDVKIIELRTQTAFHFKPGQWCDFVIPGAICSSYLRPQDEGYKYSVFVAA